MKLPRVGKLMLTPVVGAVTCPCAAPGPTAAPALLPPLETIYKNN